MDAQTLIPVFVQDGCKVVLEGYVREKACSVTDVLDNKRNPSYFWWDPRITVASHGKAGFVTL
jgi:arginyl-tRNA--protein-N-Asp/Glu arginylyltransferase